MTKYIAIDGDGVLFDYNKAAANLYESLYNEKLKEVHPKAYNFDVQYDLQQSSEPQFKSKMYSLFDKHEVWGKMPAIEGALEATRLMKEKGYTLVCLTSMPPRYQYLRHQNALSLGYPIDHVVAVDRRQSRLQGIENPKKQWILDNKPVAFIDDLLINFLDMADIKDTQLVWLDNQHCNNKNPNDIYDKNQVHTITNSLMDFAKTLPQYNNLSEYTTKSLRK